MTGAKDAPKSAAKKRGLGRGLEALLGSKAADVQPLQAFYEAASGRESRRAPRRPRAGESE